VCLYEVGARIQLPHDSHVQQPLAIITIIAVAIISFILDRYCCLFW
jgi:hypothetical protein